MPLASLSTFAVMNPGPTTAKKIRIRVFQRLRNLIGTVRGHKRETTDQDKCSFGFWPDEINTGLPESNDWEHYVETEAPWATGRFNLLSTLEANHLLLPRCQGQATELSRSSGPRRCNNRPDSCRCRLPEGSSSECWLYLLGGSSPSREWVDHL